MLPVARSSFHAITGLRFFLALNILLYHYGRPLFAEVPSWIRNVVYGGYAGTGIFFVVSGFVLTYVYTSRKPINARSFWTARFTRLYPLYLIGLIVMVPFLFQEVTNGTHPQGVIMGVGLAAPIMLQAWDPNTACVWNCPTWALSAEAFYYLLFPFLALTFYARPSTMKAYEAFVLLIGLWLLALAPPTLYVIADRTNLLGESWPYWLNMLKFNPLSRFPEFLFGTVLARFFIARQSVGYVGKRTGSILSVLAVVMLLTVLNFSPSIPYPILHNGLLMPVTAILIFTLAAGYGPIVGFLSLAPFIRLGEASYALFVFHAPIWHWQEIFAARLGIGPGDGYSLELFIAAYLAIAIAASLVIHRLIEVPARDLLRGVFEGKPAAQPKPSFAFNRRLLLNFGALLGVLAFVLFNVNLYNAFAPPAPAAPASVRAEYGPLIQPDRFVDGVENSGWLPVSGEWSYEDGSLVQHRVEDFDQTIISDGFLKAPYHYRVEMRLLRNPGAGVVFNAPQQDSKNGAHMVRYGDDGAGMTWGYYDAAGQYVEQGYAATFPPEEPIYHVLDVMVDSETYSVVLDGLPLVEGVPLVSREGYAGLQSSVGVVAFDSAELLPLVGDGTDTAREGGVLFQESFTRPLEEAGWVPIDGDWVLEDAITDRQHEGFDHNLLYQEVFGAPYELSVSLHHRESSGGGLLFNIPEASGKSGGHMVRFSEDGQALFWGYFDENGNFIGQGDISVTPPGNETQRVGVRVADEAYSVLLNGELVAEGVPLHNNEGHIGLTSSESVVSFTDIEVARD